jgi:hypothetical protein
MNKFIAGFVIGVVLLCCTGASSLWYIKEDLRTVISDLDRITRVIENSSVERCIEDCITKLKYICDDIEDIIE